MKSSCVYYNYIFNLDFRQIFCIFYHISKRMKKDNHTFSVCEIVEYAKIAGTEKHVYLLATGLAADRYETCVCTFESGALVDMLKAKSIETVVIPGTHTLLNFLQLIRFLRKRKFDIVHCHSGGYACIAAKIAGANNIVYTKHGIGFTGDELKNRGFLRKLRDLLIDQCVRAYIALTEHDRQIMHQKLYIPNHKIHVINNGIDPAFGQIKSASPGKNPTIGCVARLNPQKGLTYLIEAIPSINEKIKNLKVILAGDGDEGTRLKELARKLGILKQIEFSGYIKSEKAAEVIGRMDIFVLPSLWEGFPYTILEAMMMGKPIVTTDIFGINEIIDHNKTGILVPPKNSAALAVAVIDLLINKEKARFIGAAAHKKAQKYYTVDRTVSQIDQLYSSLVARG